MLVVVGGMSECIYGVWLKETGSTSWGNNSSSSSNMERPPKNKTRKVQLIKKNDGP